MRQRRIPGMPARCSAFLTRIFNYILATPGFNFDILYKKVALIDFINKLYL